MKRKSATRDAAGGGAGGGAGGEAGVGAGGGADGGASDGASGGARWWSEGGGANNKPKIRVGEESPSVKGKRADQSHGWDKPNIPEAENSGVSRGRTLSMGNLEAEVPKAGTKGGTLCFTHSFARSGDQKAPKISTSAKKRKKYRTDVGRLV
eukprot:TRINITY_DN6294_c0_g1_i1.p1 TRINITY_DN6294_c0_g1~~TRINITY_DN6294_c0_g1_i1.p1  ORF type:complete len:152 (+),score=39.50 TRINITY_DN6294_c0_g1_i1:342-797(+)